MEGLGELAGVGDTGALTVLVSDPEDAALPTEGAWVLDALEAVEDVPGWALRRSEGSRALLSRSGITGVGCWATGIETAVVVVGAELRPALLTRTPPPTPIATPAATAATQSQGCGLMR